MTTTTESKCVGTDALLTLSTGKMLCSSFADVQALGDFLASSATMTHNYANEAFAKALAAEIHQQFPWTADEDKIFADYPDLDTVEDKSAAILSWLDEHIYPEHGRTVTVVPPGEPVRIGFWTGLENLGKNHRS